VDANGDYLRNPQFRRSVPAIVGLLIGDETVTEASERHEVEPGL
jgi:hypothetical protein